MNTGREETIAELKRARHSWSYVMNDDLTRAIGNAVEILENENALIDRVLEIIEHLRLEIDGEPEDKEAERIWNAACDMMRKYVLDLKGSEE